MKYIIRMDVEKFFQSNNIGIRLNFSARFLPCVGEAE